MAAKLKVVQAPTPGRVIDFEEVAHALKNTANHIGRFAAGVDYGYFLHFYNPSAPTAETSTLYQIVIDAGDYTSLVIRAYELNNSLWGIRATLHYMEDELLCAAWMFTDGIAPQCVTGPPHCVKCLANDCGGACHPDINVGLVTVKALPNQIVRWVRGNLPSGGFRSAQHQTGMLAA